MKIIRGHLSLIMIFLLGLILSFPAAAKSEKAGKIVFVLGQVMAIDKDKKQRKIRKGSAIYSGDTIKTNDKGMTQMRMVDSAFVAIKKNSTFVVDNYKFGEKISEQKSSFKLVKGGFRAITGIIGKNNRDNYDVKTPVATLGIRGTDYEVNLSPKGELFVGVLSGGVSVSNAGGAIDLDPNQYAHVADANQAPRSIPKPEGLFFSSDSVKNDKAKNKDEKGDKDNKKDKKEKSDKGDKETEGDKEKEEKDSDKEKDRDKQTDGESEDNKDKTEGGEEVDKEETDAQDNSDKNADGEVSSSDEEGAKTDGDTSADVGTSDEGDGAVETNTEDRISDQDEQAAPGADAEDSVGNENQTVEGGDTVDLAVSETTSDDTQALNAENVDTFSPDVESVNNPVAADLGGVFDIGLDENDMISSDAALDDFTIENNLFSNPVDTVDPISPPAVTDDTLLSDLVKETTQEETFTETVEEVNEPVDNWTEVVINNDSKRRLILSGADLVNSSDGTVGGLATGSNIFPVNDATTTSLGGFYIQHESSTEERLYVEQITAETVRQLDAGFDPTTNLSWGRWAEGTISNTLLNLEETQVIDLGDESLHWISGVDNSVITTLPIEGSATYTLLGNTNPTDNHGNTGVLGSATFDVNFTNQSASTSLNLGINNQAWSANAGNLSIAEGQFQGDVSVQVDDNTTGVSATGSGSVLGGFTGPANSTSLVPAGAAMSYQLNASPNGTDTRVSGVAAFGEKQ